MKHEREAMKPVNRLEPDDEGDLAHLVPSTSIDHLLSPEQRQHARQDRDALAALGRQMDQRAVSPVTIYRVFYEFARKMIADGISPEELRAQWLPLTDGHPDSTFAAAIREAYDDALAGRPPRPEAGESA
jgi:hypothetical protein